MRDYTNNELRQIVADADRCKRLEQELSNVLADCASQHAADQERIAALEKLIEFAPEQLPLNPSQAVIRLFSAAYERWKNAALDLAKGE